MILYKNIERNCHLEFFLEVLTEKKSNSRNATNTEVTLAIRSRRKGPTENRILKNLNFYSVFYHLKCLS